MISKYNSEIIENDSTFLSFVNWCLFTEENEYDQSLNKNKICSSANMFKTQAIETASKEKIYLYYM